MQTFANKKIWGPILIFIAAMLWATDAPFRVYLTQSLTASTIVLLEHVISFVILLPITISCFHEFKKLSFREWAAVFFIGIGGSALASVAFTTSFSYVNPSVAILLQKLQPLIAIGLAVTVLREKLTRRFWIWAVLALTGAYIVSFPDLVPRLYDGEVFTPNAVGAGFALLAALLWGASTVFGRFVVRKISFKAMTSLRFTVALLFLSVWNIGRGTYSSLPLLTARDWLFIGIIAMASGVVSLTIYYKGLTHSKASVATIAELGFPVAAVAVNWIFLKDTLNLIQLGGMFVLLGAILQLARINATSEGEGEVVDTSL